MDPVASIVIPCHNAAAFVGDTVRSVLTQSLAGWELVLVDDGSSDGSADAAADAGGGDPRVRIRRQPNRGVAAARNAGFAASSPASRYLLFLDADDLLDPAMLATAVGYLDAHSGVGLLHVGHTCVDAEGRPLPPDRGGVGPTVRRVPHGLGVRALRPTEPVTPFAALFGLCWIVPSVVVMRRSVYERTPGFDESFGHVYEDADLFLQMALRAPAHYLPEPLVRYRRHPSQSTRSADHVNAQERKLRAKWRRPAGLTREQRAVVEAAWRFVEGRVVPAAGMRAAARHLARLEPLRAARFVGGAARRYAASFVSRRPFLEPDAAVALTT